MKEVLVLAEHRRGELREVTFEALGLARSLAETSGGAVTCVLLGFNVGGYAEKLSGYSDKVLLIEHELLKAFNSDVYQKVLAGLIRDRKPFIAIMGHTSMGIELAPRLAAELNLPLATDCVGVKVEGEELRVARQIYGGKINAELVLRRSETYLVTIRPGTFPMEAAKPVKGEVVRVDLPPLEEVKRKRFIEYVEPPKAEVDITRADIIVSVGRGIREAKNIPLADGLAKALGGVLACSRPVVDKGWLPKDRQVGSSGKTVKPKLYLALGISGAFQHVMGMKGSQLIIAVNKDPNAPIFQVAHYGVVEDLFKVIPALTSAIAKVKGAS
ncbi:MAG: electron transfer flavoprotein subunit alpha/FixB family protein [Candidatus Nezhaarchaeales archaeon]